MARAPPQLAIIASLVSGVLVSSTLVATTASVVLSKRGIVDAWPRCTGHDRTHHVDAVGKRAVLPSRPGNDTTRTPVEHVAGSVDDGERGDDDVAELQARGANPAFHAAKATPAVHLANRCAGAGANVPFGHGAGGCCLAGRIRRLRVGPNPRIADRQIVDDGGDDNGDSQIGRAPVEPDLALLEESQHAAKCRKGEHAAAREEQRVDALDRAHRLEQHDLSLAGRGSVVVDSGGHRVSNRIAVHPVGRRVLVKCPTRMPGTSVSEPARGRLCFPCLPERATAPATDRPKSRLVSIS